MTNMNQIEHYLVVDLEATCSDDRTVPKDERETIEIGAVMICARTHQSLEEYQAFVKPVRHTQLTDFCRELTNITQWEVDAAETFPEIFPDFLAWANEFPHFVFCSWGDYDRFQFESDCAYHKMDYPFGENHINLKAEFAGIMGRRKKMSLQAALASVGLEFRGSQHRGIDDARNTAELIPYIFPLY